MGFNSGFKGLITDRITISLAKGENIMEHALVTNAYGMTPVTLQLSLKDCRQYIRNLDSTSEFGYLIR